jgi:hypothetical protein
VCLLETSAARGRSPLDLALRPRPLLNQTPKLGGIFFPCFWLFIFFEKEKNSVHRYKKKEMACEAPLKV